MNSPRICGHCGADLSDRKEGTVWCDGRCRKRAAKGLPPAPKTRRYHVALCHPSFCVEPCPRCGFPEADGGYCADCGWTAPLPGTLYGETLHPAGSCHGPVYGPNGVVVSRGYPP